MAGKPRRQHRDRRDDGVSDVVGSVILVGITVTMAAALGLLLFNFEGPKDRPETSLALSATPGNANWGNGDERLVVRHLGGDALREAETTILYSINDGATVSISGAALAFPSDRLVIGQSWSSGPLTLQSSDSISLRLVHRGETNVVLAADRLIPGQISSGSSCPFDSTIPSAAWTQSPTDLTIASSGAVTVTMVLTDDCAGVSASQIPHLYWALSPAVPTDQGAMTSLGSNTWQATIPQPPGNWLANGLKTLQYYASPLADERGNSGQSSTRNDLVDLSGSTYHYVTSTSVEAPTPALVDGGNLGAEDGLTATLGEGVVGGPCTPGLDTIVTNAEITTTGWTTTGNTPRDATTSNNGWRSNSNSGPGVLRLGFPDPAAGCSITSVVVRLEQSITRYSNDGWTVQACTAGGGCGTATAFQASGVSSGSSNPTDVTLTFDVTALPPPGGWSWSAVNSLELGINPTLSGGKDNNGGTSAWRVDFVQVEVTSVQTYTSTLQLDWTGMPAGTGHYLDLRYLTPADEAYYVNVWDWSLSSYTTRGTLPAGTASLTQFTYLLTANEVQSGAVRVRIVDANPNDTTSGTLTLDYARVDRV